MIQQLSIGELNKRYCFTRRPIHYDNNGNHNGWGKKE